MKIVIEKIRDAAGHLVDLQFVDAATIMDAGPNTHGFKYVQVIDGKCMNAFLDRDLLVLEVRP